MNPTMRPTIHAYTTTSGSLGCRQGLSQLGVGSLAPSLRAPFPGFCSSTGGDLADRAQLIDSCQVDDAFADQLLGALWQFQHLHPRCDPRLGPAERLRGAVLGEAAVGRR